MKQLQLEWMHVNHHEILKQIRIDPSGPDGIEALTRMAAWEKELKPLLGGHCGYELIREPEAEGEPGSIYCAVTLGHRISQELDALSHQGRLWEASLLDTLADQWLIQGAQKQFEEIAKLCRAKGWGLSTRRMPGAGYPLSMAAKIIEALKAEQRMLHYREPGFLEPIKSLAYFYETTIGGDIPHHDEECASCVRKDCPRRNRSVRVDIIQGDELSTVFAQQGDTLLKVLQNAGCAPDAPCGGRGTCGGCEVDIHTDTGVTQRVLACTVTLELPLKVSIPDNASWQMAANPVLLKVIQEPLVTRMPVKDYFANNGLSSAVSLAALSSVQAVNDVAGSGWFLKQEERITGYSTESDRLIGAAIDLGSTTVVVSFIDLETGHILCTEGFANPLRAYGADILSRLADPSRSQGMTHMIRKRLGQIFDAPRHKDKELAAYAIGGNNAMAQILLGLSSEGLCRAPYWHWLHARVELPAGDFWPDKSGLVTVLPGVSPFTGGDLTAGIIHTGIHETPLKTLYLDLGTNGEMALGNKEGILVTAAAAGPAFENLEGAGGVGAIQGAVKKVQYLGSGRWHVETIEDMPAVGLCGSGLISLIAELVRYGFIGADGTLAEEDEGTLSVTPGVSVTQQDIRNFQLAKAAFRAGVEVLLKMRGWEAGDLEQVVIAGGFSRDLIPRDLLVTGFLPPVDPGIVSMAGNACLGGLCDFLLNKDARNGIYMGTESMSAVNLGDTADFEALFIRHINFK